MEFYVTALNLDTFEKVTGSIEMFDGATIENINKYFDAKCSTRFLILSVWSAQEIAEMIVRGETPPAEMLQFFGDAPEPDVPLDQDEREDWDAWYGRSNPPPDPFDRGQDDEDYEDGDDWKQLLK